MRHVLIGLQVTASALLLICSAIFLRSAASASTFDPGIRTADMSSIEIRERAVRSAMVQAVSAEPLVTAMAASWPDPMGGPRRAFAEAAGDKIAIGYKFVSPEVLRLCSASTSCADVASPTRSAPPTPACSSSRSRSRASSGRAATRRSGPEPLTRIPSPDARRADEPPAPAADLHRRRHRPRRGRLPFRRGQASRTSTYRSTPRCRRRCSPFACKAIPIRRARRCSSRLTAIDPNMGQVMTMRTMAKMEAYSCGSPSG